MISHNTDYWPGLISHLSRNIEQFGQVIQVKEFPGGQSNPTYKIDTSTGSYVLRRQPDGRLLQSAHAVDREFRVMNALSHTNVPVPEVFYLCTDVNVIGSQFFVMEYVDGDIHWDPALKDLPVERRKLIYRNACKVLSELHRVDFCAIGLGEFGKPGGYLQRQLYRWKKQYKDSQTEDDPAMSELIHWLEGNLPRNNGKTAVIHGDYRLDNIIFHPRGDNVLSVLDWELSTLGHPYLDLAYQCMQLRISNDAILPGLGGIDRSESGLPTEEEYVAWYCEFSGISEIEDWRYFIAFSYFKFSAILQGIKKRAIDGNASSQSAMEYGSYAKPMAEAGRDLIRS